MKKLVILVIAAALLLVGCAKFFAFIKPAQDFICNPTAEQKHEAQLMLVALDAVQAAGAIFVPEIAVFKASAVLETIMQGGCFLVAELQQIFDILDAAEAAKLKAKGLVLVKIDTYPALRRTLEK